MNTEMKFAENVFLIDTAFLKNFVSPLREYLRRRLEREISPLDWPLWLNCLALDMGIELSDKNENQVILLHDEDTRSLDCCDPSDLQYLDGKACRTGGGEFTFCCVTPAEMTDVTSLFIDLMTLALDSSEVKQLLLLPYGDEDIDRIMDTIDRISADGSQEALKKVCFFSTDNPPRPVDYAWDKALYSVTYAMGIKEEEI